MQLDKKKTILLVALFAGASLVLLAGSLLQFTQASTTKPEIVVIDFSAYPENDVIELKRGESVTLPIKVESPADAEYELQLAVVPDRNEIIRAEEIRLPDPVTASVDKESIVLSKQDQQVTHMAENRVERTSAATLTVSAESDALPKEYSFLLEASRLMANGDELVAAKYLTVKVS